MSSPQEDAGDPRTSGSPRRVGAADVAHAGKEKKRVGFTSDSPHPQDSQRDISTSPNNGEHDGNSTQVNSTQAGAAGHANPNDLHGQELTAALEKIVSPEHHDDPVRRPKPVLRKSTVLDSSDEPGNEDNPPYRSAAAARDRADRLAGALVSSIDPDSGLTLDLNDSVPETFDAGGDRLGNSPEDEVHDEGHGTNLDDNHALSAGKGAQEVANELVRSHTRRNRLLSRIPGRHRWSRPGSGTGTPVEHDAEYVSRPESYHGGILGALLKLYNDERHGHSSDNSAVSTPNRTPRSSPPASIPGTPRLVPERPRSGLFSLRPNHSASSLGLAGLIESSSKFAAPGSAEISGALTDKVHHDRQPPPRKRDRRRRDEEARITVHIAEIIQRQRYLLQLCRALMLYGAPTHRLEAYMAMSARALAIEGQFLYMPGCMVIAFDDASTHTTEMRLVRAGAGVDLGRMHDVHEIYKEVVHDRISAEEAAARLDVVMAHHPKFPVWLRVLLYGLASACVAPFGFEGRWVDLPPAFVLGCVLGWLQLQIAPGNELYANVFEISAAVLTSFLARALGSIRGGSLFCFSALAQSSIALILPGYMVLCSSLELQSHAMLAGSVRMVYSMIYTLFLGYGITIGTVLYGYMDRNATSAVHCDGPLDRRWDLLFVPLFTLCLCIINQAKWKQMPVMLAISFSGYIVNSYSSAFFEGSGQVSNSLGAVTIGVLANLYSRLGRHVENFALDVWEGWFEPALRKVQLRARRLGCLKKKHHSNQEEDPEWSKAKPDTFPMDMHREPDPEQAEREDADHKKTGKEQQPLRRARQIGFGLAAAAMLPAIFVQVPSGLAVSGSLLSGVTSADQITGNSTASAASGLNDTAFTVLFSVIQVAISISVGLSLSALLVYPFGKRRSGLFSF